MKRLIAALTALQLTGCTVAPSTPPTPPTNTAARVPLPPHAVLDPAGKAPEETTEETFIWPGSLAPTGDKHGPEVEQIKQRGRIIVGIDQSQYLLSYRDGTTGTMRGFEVALAEEIARDLFGSAEEHVDFRFVDSTTRTELLESGQVDIVIRTMSITPQRAQHVSFSTPYLTSHVRVLVPQDRNINAIGDLDGHTICVVDGTNLVNIARTIGAQSPILRTRTWTDCLMATQQFQADAILADDAILAGLVAQDPHTTILPTALATQRYAVGVANGNDALVRHINATIERIRADGTWHALYNQWLAGSLAERTPPPAMYRPEPPRTEGDTP